MIFSAKGKKSFLMSEQRTVLELPQRFFHVQPTHKKRRMIIFLAMGALTCHGPFSRVGPPVGLLGRNKN